MVDGAAYRATWATEDAPEDMEGVPKKAEGNTGFQLRAYPCRQLVALRPGAQITREQIAAVLLRFMDVYGL